MESVSRGKPPEGAGPLSSANETSLSVKQQPAQTWILQLPLWDGEGSGITDIPGAGTAVLTVCQRRFFPCYRWERKGPIVHQVLPS